MPSWKDVPKEVKARFPPPPNRETFGDDEEAFEEAMGAWQQRVGRNLGLAVRSYDERKAYYLRHSRMLVPKLACQHGGEGWHIHWPKDLPNVLSADSQEQLIPLLASHLESIGRVTHTGQRVAPDNGCAKCR
jgi:hypothetical protein